MSVRRGEQAHRRAVLMSVAGLIVMGTSPVFGHHLSERADALLLGQDHIGGLCLIALHVLLAPVHSGFHMLLLCGFVYAAWDRASAWYGLRQTLRSMEPRVVHGGDGLYAAARRAGLGPDRVHVVDGLPNPAFTAGFWRPDVYVAAALVHTLDVAQLEAVLAHEAAHVRRRDPLRLSLMRFLACTLFYIPALRRLADDLTDEAEIAADDAALARTEPLVLASAILSLAEWPGRHARASALRRGSAVAFQPFGALKRVDVLERRIRRLAGEPVAAGTHVTRRSLAGASTMLAAVWLSGLVMAHPLPAESAGLGFAPSHAHTASHCRHQGVFALRHLFCLGLHGSGSGGPCPHTGR